MNVAMQTAAHASTAPYAILVDLLEDASRNIDLDIAVAREHIATAREMLRGKVPTPARKVGGLLAWQEKRVRAYIEENLEESVSNVELAEVAKLSPSHFCRLFRETFGVSPHSFVIQRRVDRASTLMVGTSDTLAEIANACGFTDQSHLCRLFRRTKGSTPANWRRNNASFKQPLAG